MCKLNCERILQSIEAVLNFEYAFFSRHSQNLQNPVFDHRIRSSFEEL
jgi:hypothetical protein